MFRATLCPSSGETTVFVWHLLLVILCGWLSGMHNNYPLYTKNKLCTKVALFTGLYKDARSTKHKFMTPYSSLILRFKLFFQAYWSHCVPPKRREAFTPIRCIAFQQTEILRYSAVKTSGFQWFSLQVSQLVTPEASDIFLSLFKLAALNFLGCCNHLKLTSFLWSVYFELS